MDIRNFAIQRQSWERCDANLEQLRSPEDAQLQFNASLARAAKQRLEYSMLLTAQHSPEQITGRERLLRLREELNIDILVGPDAGKQNVIEIEMKRRQAFALDDNDIGQTTLAEHGIETGNPIPFSQRDRPIPYARRRLWTQSCNV